MDCNVKNSGCYSQWTSGNYKLCYDEIKEKVVPKKTKKATVNNLKNYNSKYFNIEEISSKGIGIKCDDLKEEVLLMTALKTWGVETKNSKSTKLSDSGAYIIKFNKLKNSYYLLYDYNFEGKSFNVKQYNRILKKGAMKNKEYFYEKLASTWVCIHYLMIFGLPLIFAIIKTILDCLNIRVDAFELSGETIFSIMAVLFMSSVVICFIITLLGNSHKEPDSPISYLYNYDDDDDDSAIGAGF